MRDFVAKRIHIKTQTTTTKARNKQKQISTTTTTTNTTSTNRTRQQQKLHKALLEEQVFPGQCILFGSLYPNLDTISVCLSCISFVTHIHIIPALFCRSCMFYALQTWTVQFFFVKMALSFPQDFTR